MAEALGLAANVAGLVSLGLSVCQGILSYYGSWKDSEAEIESMVCSVNNLSETLTHLNSRIAAASPSQDAETQVQKCLSACKTAFERLNGKLRKIIEKAPPGSYGKLERHVRKALYPFKASTLAKLQETIADARENLHLALSVMHFETTSLVAQKLDDVTTGIAQLHIAMAKMRLNRDIKDWLNPPDPSSNYNAAARRRTPGTGRWFIDGQYAAWITHPSSFYWLQGGPGCGKTILSSTVVTATSLATEQKASHPVMYYYFDFQYPEKQVAENMIRSLIYQLAAQNVEARQPLERLFQDHGNGVRRPSSCHLLQCLKDMLEASSVQSAYMILDALDECRELSELSESLATIRRWHLVQLHILATSRPERVLKDNLCELDPVTIWIQSDIVDGDIKTHVIGRLDKDSWWKQWSAPMRNNVISTLTKKAEGMFRWVDCQLAELRKSLNAPMLKKCLETLPRDLDATYARMLENIDELYQDYAIKILQWLCFANSPVTLDELNDVLAVNLGDNPAFDPDARFRNSRDIEIVCSSLLSISEEYITDLNTFYRLQRRVPVIRFAHFSVKEYLLSDRVGHSVSRYRIHEKPSQRMMAETCLIYHLQTRREREKYSLAGYAAENWCKHWQLLKQVDEVAGIYMQAAKILGLLNYSRDSGDVAEYRHPEFGGTDDDDEGFSSGKADMPNETTTYKERCQLLFRDADIRPTVNVADTPLRLAIKSNNFDRVCQMLLHPIILRTDRELFGSSSLLPLEIAIRSGSIMIAKHLLEHMSMSAIECTDMIHTHRFIDFTQAKEKAIAKIISSRLSNVVVDNSKRAFFSPDPESLRAAARRGDACFILEYKVAYRSRFRSDASGKDAIGISAEDYAKEQGHEHILYLLRRRSTADHPSPLSDGKMAGEQPETPHPRIRPSTGLLPVEMAGSGLQPWAPPSQTIHDRPRHPSLKQRSVEPTRYRSSSRHIVRSRSSSDEDETFGPPSTSLTKVPKHVREQLRLNATCRIRFIAMGYSRQHAENINHLKTKDLVSEKDNVLKLQCAEVGFLDRNIFTEFLTGLNRLYDAYSFNARQAEPAQIIEELKPFWDHYVSQMKLLRDIQKVKATLAKISSHNYVRQSSQFRIDQLANLREALTQGEAQYEARVTRTILSNCQTE